jgi:hypothetical protein
VPCGAREETLSYKEVWDADSEFEDRCSHFCYRLSYPTIRKARCGARVRSKMQGALKKEGLTEESYTQIFEIARADEGLRKKLVEFINEERQKS